MSINRTTFLLVAFGLLSPVCCSKWMMNSSLAQETESYALYSYLYRNSNWLVPEEEVAIATQPFAFDHIPASESCLKPATEEERVIVQAAKWLSTQSFAWTRQLNLGHPYRLIPEVEVNQAINCISQSHGPSPKAGCEPYARLHFVRFLSIPAFM